jgi:flagellar hook-length control protein FliK
MAVEQARATDAVSILQPTARPRGAAREGEGNSFQEMLGSRMDEGADAGDAAVQAADADAGDGVNGTKAKRDSKTKTASDASATDAANAVPADPSAGPATDADASRDAATGQAADAATADASAAGADAASGVDVITGTDGKSMLATAFGAGGVVGSSGFAAGKASGLTTAGNGVASAATLAADATQAARANAQAALQASQARMQGQAQVQGHNQQAAFNSQIALSATAQAAQDAGQARMTAVDAAAQMLAQDAAAQTMGMATTTEFSSLRRFERLGEGGYSALGAAAAAGTGAADSAMSRHALTADAAMPVATANIDAGGASMEDRMAAQVTYWLSQKTQNAELSLDLHEGQQVQVSVSMTGNEAHVAFRAGHGATRELLGSALPQLRELLGNEGVVLSGVTVDSFGAQGQNAGQGYGNDGGGPGTGERGRSGRVEIPVAQPVRPSALIGGSAGRSVDLYV